MGDPDTTGKLFEVFRDHYAEQQIKNCQGNFIRDHRMWVILKIWP